jgi:hypothetical protein
VILTPIVFLRIERRHVVSATLSLYMDTPPYSSGIMDCYLVTENDWSEKNNLE